MSKPKIKPGDWIITDYGHIHMVVDIDDEGLFHISDGFIDPMKCTRLPASPKDLVRLWKLAETAFNYDLGPSRRTTAYNALEALINESNTTKTTKPAKRGKDRQ